MCECLKIVDAQLEKFNTRVGTAFSISKDLSVMSLDIVIASEKIDTKKRGRPRTIVAAYCPFCGIKREKPASNQA